MAHVRLLPGKIADLIGLLIKQPRTVRELASLTGMCTQALQRYLNAFVAEGFVTKGERKHKSASFIYFWNPEKIVNTNRKEPT